MQILPQLQDVIQRISPETLTAFFHSACTHFRPTCSDHYAKGKDRQAVEELVQDCLDANGEDCEEYEAEINERVARLYGLKG